MSIDFASVIDLRQSGVSQLVGAGSILQPATPSFAAWRTVAGAFSAGSYFIFDTENYDIGGGYNPANGLYSAPVGGVYYFFADILSESTTTGELRHSLYKNGAMYTGNIYIQQQSGYLSRTCGAHIQMAAGDYVGVMLIQGGPTYAGASWAHFGGHFVA